MSQDEKNSREFAHRLKWNRARLHHAIETASIELSSRSDTKPTIGELLLAALTSAVLQLVDTVEANSCQHE